MNIRPLAPNPISSKATQIEHATPLREIRVLEGVKDEKKKSRIQSRLAIEFFEAAKNDRGSLTVSDAGATWRNQHSSLQVGEMIEESERRDVTPESIGEHVTLPSSYSTVREAKPAETRNCKKPVFWDCLEEIGRELNIQNWKNKSGWPILSRDTQSSSGEPPNEHEIFGITSKNDDVIIVSTHGTK